MLVLVSYYCKHPLPVLSLPLRMVKGSTCMSMYNKAECSLKKLLQFRKHHMDQPAYFSKGRGVQGPQLTIPGVVEIFFLFFIPTLLKLIVGKSNRYAAECMGPEKYEKWTEITVEELCVHTWASCS